MRLLDADGLAAPEPGASAALASTFGVSAVEGGRSAAFGRAVFSLRSRRTGLTSSLRAIRSTVSSDGAFCPGIVSQTKPRERPAKSAVGLMLYPFVAAASRTRSAKMRVGGGGAPSDVLDHQGERLALRQEWKKLPARNTGRWRETVECVYKDGCHRSDRAGSRSRLGLPLGGGAVGQCGGVMTTLVRALVATVCLAVSVFTVVARSETGP